MECWMPMGSRVIRRRVRMVHPSIREVEEEEKWRIGEARFFFSSRIRVELPFQRGVPLLQPLPPYLHIFASYGGGGRVACWPILVNLRAFENNQGWEAKRRQRNSNEPFSRKAVH